MSDLDPNLLKFFTDSYQAGIIGLVGTKDTIGLAIREAQRAEIQDKKPSLWSHSPKILPRLESRPAP